MSVAAVLLAATRDTNGQPMALLPWGNDLTLVEYQVNQLRLAGVRDIEVVVAPDDTDVIRLVSADNVEPIIDPVDDGASAMRVGASAVPRGTTTAIVARVDQPRPASVYVRLLEAHTPAASLTRPSLKERRGAPVVVNERTLEALRNVRDDAALTKLMDAAAGTVEVPWDSDIVLLRVTTAEDCVRACERYAL